MTTVYKYSFNIYFDVCSVHKFDTTL